MSQLEFIVDHARPQAKVSVILLDWSVRESFHSLHYLNRQSVDRSRYELIWIEFYDRKPAALMEAVQAAEAAGQPLIDKLVVMNYPRDVIFHKHRMYNLGIVLSEGEICVICDSDAMFTPNFIQSIITAFEENPQSAVHLDEVRSISRQFYPFNFPSFEEFLASKCPNWRGHTTKGLDNSKDMLHEANYGACLAARREDLIIIGGSDEHLDYLGYICGPYDLTFRLANAGCRERWLTSEYIYHSWHPGESGINIDYHGPSDGRGMSTRSLSARKSGAIRPGLENGAIQALRTAQAAGQSLNSREALNQLTSPRDEQWRQAVRTAEDQSPELVKKAFHGAFDVYSYRGCWYAIPTCDERFDPDKAVTGVYATCLRGHSQKELDRWIRRHERRNLIPRVQHAISETFWKLWRATLTGLGYQFDLPYDPEGDEPQTVRPDFRGHNIVHFRRAFYGVAFTEGAFDPALATSDDKCPYVRGSSTDEVKAGIRRREKALRLIARKLRQLQMRRATLRALRQVSTSSRRRLLAVVVLMPQQLLSVVILPALDRLRGLKPYDPQMKLPQIVREGYRNHNIIFYRGTFYSVHQSAGAFDPGLLKLTCPYLSGNSIPEVQNRIVEWIAAQPRPPWSWRQIAVLRLAVRLVRPFVPKPLRDAIRRRRNRNAACDTESAIAGMICSGEIQAERKAA